MKIHEVVQEAWKTPKIDDDDYSAAEHRYEKSLKKDPDDAQEPPEFHSGIKSTKKSKEDKPLTEDERFKNSINMFQKPIKPSLKRNKNGASLDDFWGHEEEPEFIDPETGDALPFDDPDEREDYGDNPMGHDEEENYSPEQTGMNDSEDEKDWDPKLGKWVNGPIT